MGIFRAGSSYYFSEGTEPGAFLGLLSPEDRRARPPFLKGPGSPEFWALIRIVQKRNFRASCTSLPGKAWLSAPNAASPRLVSGLKKLG